MRRIAFAAHAPAKLLLTGLLLGGLGASACGASPPREADIYHDPALRPGVVEASSEAERELLSRLHDPDLGAVEVGGRRYAVGAPYHAASGRRCREVASGDARRLACEAEGGWVFVPDVTGSAEGAP